MGEKGFRCNAIPPNDPEHEDVEKKHKMMMNQKQRKFAESFGDRD